MNEENGFLQLFDYNASLHGLQYCQFIIDINNTYLKEKYCRVFFVATSVDVKGQLFSIAFNIMNAENNDN